MARHKECFMKRTILNAGLTMGLLGPILQMPTQADDIDLYKVGSGGSSALPNVLLVIDNSANWNATMADGKSKRIVEHEALHQIFSSSKYEGLIRVGVMVFSNGNQPNGGKVLRDLRDLTPTYRTDLATLFDPAKMTSNGPIAKSNNAPYALMMNEAYLYFGGKKPAAGVQDGDHDKAAIDTNGNYDSPSKNNQCGPNYVILIGNGAPDSGESKGGGKVDGKAEDMLRSHGGILPGDPIKLNPDNYQSNWADEFARFMHNTDVVPDSIQVGKQTVSTYVINVQGGAPKTQPEKAAQAWLKSIAREGTGSVEEGYREAYNAQDIQAAVADVLENKVQAVNSVFAATTLPVSVNVRGTYLNQVYMGQFRPDESDRPRWLGNLKLYQLAADPNRSYDAVFLADKSGKPAQSDKGFIVSSAVSYWTKDSDPDFWSFAPSGTPPSASDSPDGDVVEKGAAAQGLRERASARRIYTCISCSGTLDSFSTSNASAMGLSTGLVDWVIGKDNADLDSGTTGNQTEDRDADTADVRASIHGDVLHSTPAVINYNDTGADGAVVVYYGANDGMIHAVQGGKGTYANDGQELWAFVPKEFFGRLHRLRDNLKPSEGGEGKEYFADGSIGVYTLDANKDGKLEPSYDKAYLFVTMRRGGRFMYAFDVIDPQNPRLLWRHSSNDSGFGELGQTWSKPSIAVISDGDGGSTPVIVFGAGYDEAVDDLDSDSDPSNDSNNTHTMGRGVFVVDAESGTLIWRAGPQNNGGPGAFTLVGQMTYSIPSDVTIIDRDGNGLHDRIYVGDTGGQVWRVDMGDTEGNNWAVYKLASIGAAAGHQERKFLYPSDVVYGKDAKGAYDAVLIGSGDREDPLDTTVENRFYMFKDHATGLDGSSTTTITESTLYDVTDNKIQVGTLDEQTAAQNALAQSRGWYLRLVNEGEKVVTSAVTLSGSAFFNTMQPPTAISPCGLGTSRFYTVDYRDARATLAYNAGSLDALETLDRINEGTGGGFPPSPVPVIVEINGKKYQAVISGTEVQQPPGLALGARHRVFWYKEME
jgi:type IV pilus assembly protein PilY1